MLQYFDWVDEIDGSEVCCEFLKLKTKTGYKAIF